MFNSRIYVVRDERKDSSNSSTGHRRGLMHWTPQRENQQAENKQVRDLDEEEGCGQRVGGMNSVISEVGQFQKMTEARV